MRPKSQSTEDLLNRLAAAEERFLQCEFLAPVVRGQAVRVSLAGVICNIAVRPEDFEGWGVFRPESYTAAQWIREASLAKRQRYLELFPLLRLIFTDRRDQGWLAVPAHRGDTRFRIEGLVPVRLASQAQLFETIRARFDGANCWFESLDPRADPSAARYLRDALGDGVDPAGLERAGLTPEQKAAYALHHARRLQERMVAEQAALRTQRNARRARMQSAPAAQDRRRGSRGRLDPQRTASNSDRPPPPHDDPEARLREALAHSGAEFREYAEHWDGYTVTYTVSGQRHTSFVSKDNLTVQSAGICLAGTDARFDLASLVGVLREGRQRGLGG